MDILVTFPDGTAELRAANSLCVLDFESPPRAPHVAKHADIEGWCLDGRIARQIGHVRGSPFSWAWRLTGHTEEPYTLTGEWQKVQIETVDEQIARLTRERDAALARAVQAEKKLARATTFAFCEGELEARRSTITPGTWLHTGDPFPYREDMTLDEALQGAERWERDLGYHLPAEEVLRRCKVAVKAAGWEACAETSDERRTVFRPDPRKVTSTWVEFPRKRDVGAADLRLLASTAVNRLQGFGIAVDLTGKKEG